MADADLVIVNVPVGSAIQLPAGTSARVALETLRYHPRAGQGVLSNRHNVLVVPSDAILQAADGPYLFEAAGELQNAPLPCVSHADAWSNSHAMFHCLTTIDEGIACTYVHTRNMSLSAYPGYPQKQS